MTPASAALGQRIFLVAYNVIGGGVALLVGAMVLSSIRSMLRGESAERSPLAVPRNTLAPPLALTAVDGTRLDLAAERGRAVLIVAYDAKEADARAHADLAERARAAAEATGGATRVWALVSGLPPAEVGAALGGLSPVAVAADPEARAAAALIAQVGRIGTWWIVDRKGHLTVRGEPGDWPRHQAFRQLRFAAEP
jgi:hypothetical protein